MKANSQLFKDSFILKKENSKIDYNLISNEVYTHSKDSFVHMISSDPHKRHYLFNNHWKFIYGDQSNAQLNTYDDSDWQDIQLPHDYSLDLPYDQSGEAESGYKLGGTGWYRKSFAIDKELKGKRIVVEFGGVYMNSTVYINGHKLGTYPNGYTPFAYDLTDYIDFEGTNILAVQVNHQFPSSRWYSGSGIYRNVHLMITDQIHIDRYGIQIMTPSLKNQLNDKVDVCIYTRIKNHSKQNIDVTIKQSIREKGTDKILTSSQGNLIEIKASTDVKKSVSLKIYNPTLWSIEDPFLYEIITEIIVNDQVVDKYSTDYGFRYFDFDSEKGFTLNGKNVKLKGVSMHSDQGSLGSAAHVRAMERQVEILLNMGINAIRVTHNPAADELIKIANKEGVLVIDESFDTWIFNKNGNIYDYAIWFDEVIGDHQLLGTKSCMTWAEYDLKQMVRRGINDPSIISWSVGNEVMEGNSGEYTKYPAILEKLTKWVNEVDGTRPATLGDNKFKENWPESTKFGNILAKYDGIVGLNYADGHQFDYYHEKNPNWKLYAAETASSVNSRGVYKTKNHERHLTSYDESTVGWGKLSADSWHSVITRDFMAGEFVWTGFDYLGEPTPWNNVGPGSTGEWPSPKSSYFGIVDTAGIPKDRYYFYQSQWNKKVNTLHILPTWKKEMIEIDKDGKVRVDVYSNAKSVELFYENEKGKIKSYGKKKFNKHTTKAGHEYQIYEGTDKKEEYFRNLYLTWNIPYKAGSVYAQAYDENNQLITNTQGRHKISTFKEATELSISTDRKVINSDGKDLAYITIDVLDEDGKLVEDAENMIHVDVSGEGELLALDNGNQLDHEPYNSGKRKAFSGKLVAIIKSKTKDGDIIVEVTSDHLKKKSLKIKTKFANKKIQENKIVGYEVPHNYYTKQGIKPHLTSEIKMIFNSGNQKRYPVEWKVTEDLFDQIGTFSVKGTVAELGLQIATNVTIVESIGTILNYSTATLPGVANVSLPERRPLITKNGEVLDIEFLVDWQEQKAEDYKETGRVIIRGVSTVFGEKIPVVASVRVTEPEKVLSDNIAANNLIVVEEASKNIDSASLEEIIDDNPGILELKQGLEPTIWNNLKKAKSGYAKEEIVFTYATAQYLGSTDLYFYQDEESIFLPENVELYWSNEGTKDAEWTKINRFKETTEFTTEGIPNITKINYRFEGIPAVGFKIVLTSKEATEDANEYYGVGLTQIELRVENRRLNVYESASIDDIVINEKSI